MMKSVFIFLLFFISSCSAAKVTVQPDHNTQTDQTSAKKEEPRFDESFDPLSLNDDPWVIRKKKHRREEQLDTFVGSTHKDSINKKEMKEQIVFGFRIQLYSTTDYYQAIGVRDEASAKLSADIYVDYEQPYYKVRAGNFTNREMAEEERNLAKALGYPDAWVIQTNVLLKEK
jgi:hypothetical protein